MEQLLIRSVSAFFQVVSWLLVIRVILSWVRVSSYNKYVNLLYNLTEPILEPFRRLTRRFSANQAIDWSPLIAMLVIQYLVQPIIITLIGVLL